MDLSCQMEYLFASRAQFPPSQPYNCVLQQQLPSPLLITWNLKANSAVHREIAYSTMNSLTIHRITSSIYSACRQQQ